MNRIEIGPATDFATGRVRIVDIAGQQVGVVRWGESWYGIRNVCPHAQAPLCQGTVHSVVEADLDDGVTVPFLRQAGTDPVISCPWHGWEFDLRSGESIADRRFRARTYQITEEDGVLYFEPRRTTGGRAQ